MNHEHLLLTRIQHHNKNIIFITTNQEYQKNGYYQIHKTYDLKKTIEELDKIEQDLPSDKKYKILYITPSTRNKKILNIMEKLILSRLEDKIISHDILPSQQNEYWFFSNFKGTDDNIYPEDIINEIELTNHVCNI